MFFVKSKSQKSEQKSRHKLDLKNIKFPNIQTEVLAGITVALALIPESLAFAAIVKVNPMVALYTSFCMATVIAIAGGRPAMISAATGSMALLMTSLVAKHGLEYLFAATVLTGIIQFLMGVFKLGRFFTFIHPSVIAGFVNALGILIFIAQLQQFAGEPWQMYVMVAGTLAIVYLFPRITKAIPSPLVAIVAMTIAAISMNLPIRRVGDIGAITASLPSFHLPHISLSLETLSILLPYSLPLAIVGILESLLTAALVDELTDTKSSRNQEVKGQGIANIVTGFFGGMAGCGMVGQSIINVRSGATSRLSTFVSGAFLLFSIILLRDIVMQIPMAALVGVMIMVAAETFDWKSLKQLQKMPLSEAFVMPMTVIVVVWTHDLAQGVLAGVLVSAVVFAWKVTNIKTTTAIDSDGSKIYEISGEIFFGSMTHFIDLFNYEQDPEYIVIDFTQAHIWDHSAVTAVSKVAQKYRKLDKKVTLVGLNEESRRFVHKVGIPELSVR
ncbi:MAG: SulP family inorganic anion transporter [Coleofasciculus sp. Co-bin14]|nr:SulP family inorganic anion transporter [Coleofasciculus sp. Co-bin14]